MSDSDNELPPLDPELASLFAEERARPEPGADAAQARVLERLQASLSASAAAASTPVAKLLVALVVGGAIGAGVTSRLQEPKIVYVERPVASIVAIAPSVEPVVLPFATREAPAPSASVSVPSSAAPVDTLARERALLDDARASLSKGDAAGSLAATERHAREFPRGQMTEEREVLAIQSLAKLGRKSEATTRAAEFKSRYPNSVLLGVVDSVTDVDGAPK